MISGLERQELDNKVKGMSDGELMSLLQNVSTSILYCELGRRLTKDQETITKMKQILEGEK